jgi:preprotein translocase subunit SecG
MGFLLFVLFVWFFPLCFYLKYLSKKKKKKKTDLRRVIAENEDKNTKKLEKWHNKKATFTAEIIKYGN